MNPAFYIPMTCAQCAEGAGLDFEFSMAFQPIVDFAARRVFSYEALVRGPRNEPSSSIIGQVNDRNRYRFDQACRVKTIQLAARLGLATYLNINFYPGAVYRPELCIRTTIEAARTFNFPIDRIVFEVTEGEKIEDHIHLNGIVKEYQRLGFKTAIDDFGAGYSGLNLLAEFQPDFLKLDMALTRSVHDKPSRQAIVRGIIGVCRELDIAIVAEGVETKEELAWLQAAGVNLFQGYYFAHPAFEALPEIPDDRFFL
jgi:EAL domain-containing protein (putative c-di-GMP-specific phosphodiesterase class I)